MPRMLGVRGQPQTVGNRIVPQQAHGLQVMSIGFMVEEDTPMIWRGPMVTSALQQLLTETNWDSLDYLVVDLPPGTGDIQLTLAQRVPVSGCLIVTTPQDIALLDARKAVQMFRKVEMSVLGIVENMSTHICSQCGHEEPIFGSGGGSRMAEQYGVPLLGQLPLDLRIREDLDHGRPTVVSAPDSDLTARYREVARRLAARLSQAPRSLAVSLPQINIRNA
jgi:ATP-binding protein involved in chromosome partitioning